jgi:hypothetical protein
MSWESKSYFVYLRTRMALHLDDRAQASLAQMRGDVNAVLSVAPGVPSFADGLVLNLWTRRDLRELKDAWAQHLAKFEAWAIHDCESIFEGIEGGPASIALNGLSSSRLPLKQLFAVFYRADEPEPNRLDADGLVDAVANLMPGPVRTAFHFRNGRIVFLRTDAPIRMLMRRLERDFPREQLRDGRLPRRRIYEIAMTAPDDVGGLSYYGRAPIWQTVVFDGSTPAADLRPRVVRAP